MEAGTTGNCIQEAFRGFLKCLGLDGGGGKPDAAGEDPPSSSTINYEPLPTADETRANDPPADVLSSPDVKMAFLIALSDVCKIDGYTPYKLTMQLLKYKTKVLIDSTTMTTRDYTLVTIDEMINTSGGTTAESHFVELLDNGQPKMSLLTTSLISSGGGGKSH